MSEGGSNSISVSQIPARDVFVKNFCHYLNSKNYRFIMPDGAIEPESKGTAKTQLAMSAIRAAGVGFGFGLVGALSGGIDPHSEGELLAVLEDMASLGCIVGINQDYHDVSLAVLVDASGMTDEAIIGRCSLIETKAKNFRPFTMAFMKTVFGNATLPVKTNVFLIFSEPYRATHYETNLGEKCKTWSLFGKVFVLPWAVDLPGKRIAKYKGPPVPQLKLPDPVSSLFG